MGTPSGPSLQLIPVVLNFGFGGRLNTQEYLAVVGPLLNRARTVAREYKRATGRPLGITGEVAEYEVVRLLGYDICEVRQAGYDAVCGSDGSGRRVQIKGRSLVNGTKQGRLGAIDLGKSWDTVVLVMLDEDLEPVSMHEAKRSDIQKALDAPGSISRNVRRQLPINQFKRIAELVWQRGHAER